MNTTFPRVLIINKQSILKSNATGITLRSLWEEWPLESMMEIYMDEFENHVQWREDFHSVCIPSNAIERLAHGSKAQKVNTNIKSEDTHRSKSIKTDIRQFFVLTLDTFPVQLDKRTYKQISDFRPEIIYTLGASISTLTLVNSISKQYRIPILIHFMDNWVEHLQWEDNLLLKPYKAHLNRIFHRCLKQSNAGLAISPQMAKAYKEKFHIPFEAIMNSVDVNSFVQVKRRYNSPIRFVYAGGLHLDRWKALAEISRAIKETGIAAKLLIYSDPEKAKVFKSYFCDNTEFKTTVDHNQICEIYNSADVLVHTEVDSQLLKGFFKYSISTKIPEYLSSGRTVLFYGPKTMGLYDYLKENDAAYLASDYEELCEVLLQISTYENYEARLDNAFVLAQKMHDVSNARGVLKRTVCSCIQ